jgi:PAS domain S-box-containing protein
VAVGIPQDEVLSAAYRDGAWRIARAAAVLLVFTLFIVLLLRRIRREEAIAAGLLHFRRAVETCADLAFWVSRSGRFIYANQAACERLGYGHEALAGRSVNDVSPEFDQARWDRFWADLEQHGQVRFSTEALTASDESFPIGIAASRLLMAGEPYVFSIGRDLSDERANRAAVEALNATLEKRVRERTDELRATNEELEAFTSSVSHDLRAPVRAIEGFADLLVTEAGARLDGKAGHLLLRLRAAASRMNALIDGLLTLSRASRVPLQFLPVDLTALAREIVAELAAQAPERRYEATIEDGLTCRGDPVLLRQAMENLIGNAWKYSSTRWCTRIEVGAIVDGNGQREFFVLDNGVGFDAAYADKLFQPFERLHSESEFPGAGVGLATVRRIIKRHGGYIRGEGRPGQGAAFHFTLGDSAS